MYIPEMDQTTEKKVSYFSDSCISIGTGKFSKSWTKYLPSAVNVLILTPKISPNTRGDILQINFLENDEKTSQKRSHGDFAIIWDDFTCWLSKRVLKRRFSESGLSKIFKVSIFANTLAMTIILFFKMSFFEIIPFELGVRNSHNLEQGTYHRQLMC